MTVDVDLGHSLSEVMCIIFPTVKLLFPLPLFLYFTLWKEVSTTVNTA